MLYRKYMRKFGVELQFCPAHLIREVKFLIDLPHERTRVYGERLLNALRTLFRVIHRRETMTTKVFQRALERARTDVINAANWAPQCSPAKNLARRFRLHGDAYFRFLTTPGQASLLAGRTDQQPGGTSHTLRGHRPAPASRLA